MWQAGVLFVEAVLNIVHLVFVALQVEIGSESPTEGAQPRRTCAGQGGTLETAGRS